MDDFVIKLSKTFPESESGDFIAVIWVTANMFVWQATLNPGNLGLRGF